MDLAPPHVVDPSDDLSLRSEQVGGRADLLVVQLRDGGVVAGDVVAWQLPNWWEAVALFHACWRLGAVAAPLHHRLSADEVDRLASRVGARVLARPGRPLVLERLEDVTPVERPDDVAVLLATSGSTGAPKIVQHTSAGLAGKAATMVAAHGLTRRDTVLMPAPLAHISGLLNGVLLPGAAGMTTVLMDRWEPARAAQLIRSHDVTFMIGPPTFFVDLLELDDVPDNLRLISSGGAAVTEAFVRRATEGFGAVVKRTYGSTEAPTVTTWHVGDPPDKAATTDGRPTEGVELKFVAYGATAAGTNLVNHLYVRGPELFVGYDDPEATEDALDESGWFRTGDLASIDDDGWLTIHGRASDTIIRGGENISPAEVEAVCATLPGVRQVAVVGAPDERLGERVALVAVADRDVTVEEVREACLSAGLAPFKVPELVKVTTWIPTLAAGKPDRFRIASLFSRTS